MSLYSRKEIHSDDWVEFLIKYKVVKRVEEISKIEKKSTFYQYPMFQWAPGIPVLGDMKGNEEKRSDEERTEDDLTEEIWNRLLRSKTCTRMHMKDS